ncbi:Uncharacterised protein [Mycobacteroides abscessus subsp. massiliense]|nr:Uncharacterised protein [Mycobacteroides abscessus subsp. massiliense]
MSDVVQGPYLGVGIGKLDEGQAVFGHEVAHRGHLILRGHAHKGDIRMRRGRFLQSP